MNDLILFHDKFGICYFIGFVTNKLIVKFDDKSQKILPIDEFSAYSIEREIIVHYSEYASKNYKQKNILKNKVININKKINKVKKADTDRGNYYVIKKKN
ncbi:hypothetical protein [Senegalia massiliensis]|uniref:Uncharacterized protein n=1 Tax=Senegalia massiliensis TaxID=1720316 RepID=A0A845R024_9CLOT|nr:hypothetical protein [Senegalia massiliensis]NBI07554.1 hypothetical protein [Senegalia massiliensis]